MSARHGFAAERHPDIDVAVQQHQQLWARELAGWVFRVLQLLDWEARKSTTRRNFSVTPR